MAGTRIRLTDSQRRVVRAALVSRMHSLENEYGARWPSRVDDAIDPVVCDRTCVQARNDYEVSDRVIYNLDQLPKEGRDDPDR